MFTLAAPCSLLSYKDLRAQEIHPTIALLNGEEAIEFKRRRKTLGVAKAATNGLYNVKISCPRHKTCSRPHAYTVSRHPHFQLRDLVPALQDLFLAYGLQQDLIPARPNVQLVGSGDLKRLNDLQDVTLSQNRVLSDAAFRIEAPTKIGLWYRRLGHSKATLLRRMIPLLEGYTLNTNDAKKIGSYSTCSQGKFTLRASKWRLPTDLPMALECLQADICGPIVPPSCPF